MTTPTARPAAAATDGTADPRLARRSPRGPTTWSRSSSSPWSWWRCSTVGLAAVFSSPDEKAITMRDWATGGPRRRRRDRRRRAGRHHRPARPTGRRTTRNATGRRLGPLPLQKWAGVRLPVDSAKDLVLSPLAGVSGEPAADRRRWPCGGPRRADQQHRVGDRLRRRPRQGPGRRPGQGRRRRLRPGAGAGRQLPGAGPQSAASRASLTSSGTFYGGDQTRTLLLLSDGAYLEDQARAQHLGGDQWGMMNETGNYPGQPWMWLYTFWYQVPPFSTSDNADA